MEIICRPCTEPLLEGTKKLKQTWVGKHILNSNYDIILARQPPNKMYLGNADVNSNCTCPNNENFAQCQNLVCSFYLDFQ